MTDPEDILYGQISSTRAKPGPSAKVLRLRIKLAIDWCEDKNNLNTLSGGAAKSTLQALARDLDELLREQDDPTVLLEEAEKLCTQLSYPWVGTETDKALHRVAENIRSGWPRSRTRETDEDARLIAWQNVTQTRAEMRALIKQGAPRPVVKSAIRCYHDQLDKLESFRVR